MGVRQASVERLSAAMLECVAGAATAAVSVGVTLFAGWAAKRKLLRHFVSTKDLTVALQARGFDLEHDAMQSHITRMFKKIGKLGEGASGEVYRVKHLENKEEYAMKVIEKASSRNDQESLDTELSCLRRLRHPHIVNLIQVKESQKMIWIFMECMDGGGLYERIVSHNNFTEAFAARIMKQVLKAVHYMHSMGVVHRDLKAENVLLTSDADDADVKIADFGLAVDLGHEPFNLHESFNMKQSKVCTGGFCGSPICMAPEVATKDAAYGPQCDIWSCGCMTHELLCGQPPFNAKSAKQLYKIVREGPGPALSLPVWKTISEDAKSLVKEMLQREPEERPSAKETLAKPWFAKAPAKPLPEAQDALKLRRTTHKAKEAKLHKRKTGYSSLSDDD